MSEGMKVWDPMLRVFHWLLVIAFTVSWLTGDEWDEVHEISGYVIAGLLTFRLLWGLIGPRYARFAQFIARPSSTLAYLKDMSRGEEKRYLGHNPAGAAMIVVLILSLAIACLSGWLYHIGWFANDEWLEEVHEFFANGLLVLVAFHVGGVIIASLRHGENLARAMVTGQKRPPESDDIA
ncbi:cytochrome b/b6 domain-containing protein [Marinobacter mobilis]|uniref:Cytochrome b n=1 Tax=Marinobacter mobilis TaxID=488533 RepID=A0A1H3DGB9_9GAMM|nr:cytochrome b/b6 domain-containing protein [Marinobacter mobilis]SDX65411.1 Cytochrome b [Marinobacter mobilis]